MLTQFRKERAPKHNTHNSLHTHILRLQLAMLDLGVLLVQVVFQAAHLRREDFALLSSNSATDKRILTIKVLRDLLERSVASLNVEEVDDRKFDLVPSVSFSPVLACKRLTASQTQYTM